MFLYSYEADFIQGHLKKKEKKLARSFNFTFRYKDDVLSLNNSRLGDFADSIYHIELEIKDTTNTDRSAWHLDLHIDIDSEERLRTKLYDKRYDFNFPIVNFPFKSSNIPAAPAYIIYKSRFIRYSRACGSYQNFLDRGLLLTRKVLKQVFLLVTLKSWHGWPLWNICVTNHHGYVPPVVNTSRYFPHSWFITGFTRQVPLVEQELRGIRSIVLCACFVNRCLSFCTFYFGHKRTNNVLLWYTDSDFPCYLQTLLIGGANQSTRPATSHLQTLSHNVVSR